MIIQKILIKQNTYPEVADLIIIFFIMACYELYRQLLMMVHYKDEQAKLTHCGLMTPYDTELGQLWLR